MITQDDMKFLLKYWVKKIMVEIAKKAGWLGSGPIGYVVAIGVTWVVKYAMIQGGMFVIKLDKHEDRVEFDESKKEYNQAKAEGKSEDEIKKLEENLISKYRKFGRWG